MIRQIGHQLWYVTVLSARRPATVQPMTDLVGPATWIVADDEDVATYSEAGAKAVVVGGTIPQARNRALELAFKDGKGVGPDGLPNVQLSDDLLYCYVRQRFASGKRQRIKVAFTDMLTMMYAGGKHTGYKLWGVAPNDNLLNYNHPYSFANFIIGDLMVVWPNELRFDPQFVLKEDYDYTCQHIATYGGVMRFNDLMPKFKHYTNAGGAVRYRTPELVTDINTRLMAKWPGWFRPHQTRPDELVMKVPQ